MNRENISVPCCIIRGGTSKGIFFKENDIPGPGPDRDAFILRAFGSPDTRQIDGLGGANSLTSKVAIIGVSDREDADVDYTFGQVSFAAPVIDWKGNCGNISSGAALFAVDMNMVKVEEPVTTIRLDTPSGLRGTTLSAAYPVLGRRSPCISRSQRGP